MPSLKHKSSPKRVPIRPRTKKSLRTAKKDDKRGTNPNSLANLEDHKFPPGVSGNPGGRPKVLGEAYREWLAKVNNDGVTNAERVAETMGRRAMLGDVSAAREMRAATEGEKNEVVGANGGPIKVEDINATRDRRWEHLAPVVAAAIVQGDPDADAEGSLPGLQGQ